jgi:hypothetical protein
VLNVYLTPGEEDSHAFDNWNIIPKLSDKKAWKSVSQATLKSFQKNLEKMSNPKNNVQLALQVLQTSNGQIFCKVVDTIFLPME